MELKYLSTEDLEKFTVDNINAEELSLEKLKEIDGTLIKTKSGEISPKGIWDMEFRDEVFYHRGNLISMNNIKQWAYIKDLLHKN